MGGSGLGEIDELFKVNSSGIETQKDSLDIQFSHKELEQTREDVENKEESFVQQKYSVKDSRDWNFYIGGYQPAQKWLKDRKGRVLTNADIEHYQKIIVVLVETDKIMKEIDAIKKL